MAHPFAPRPGSAEPAQPGLRPAFRALVVPALLSAMALGTGLLASPPPAAAAMFGYGLTPPDVADLLYTRFRVARVMRIYPTGDVFQAEAIDRRGYRVHYTIDAYNGALLESYVMGGGAYEAPVPLPPGLVPGVPAPQQPTARLPTRPAAPPSEGWVRPQDPGAPPRANRQARTPDPGAAPTSPRVKQTPEPKLPPKSLPDAAPATAARQPADKPAEPAPDVKTTVAPPSPVESAPLAPPASPAPSAIAPPADAPAAVAPAAPPAKAAPAPAASAEVRQALPTRTPEPLIDPKTGKPPVSVPVTPLDDAQPAAKAPIQIVPPATLE
ncbi:MAG: hypothetical protein U1E62_01780 [Alsobacter sp.]